jgi:hypothetical protein
MDGITVKLHVKSILTVMKKYVLFLAALMCMAFSCVREESENYHRTVKVTNHSDYRIYITFEWVEQYYNPEENLKYPWDSNNKKRNWEEENRVNSGETNTTAIKTYNRSIEGFLTTDKHIKVFFVNADMYDQVPIGSPIPNETLLDSRVYDLKDLQTINFHIHYPLEENSYTETAGLDRP